MKPWKPAEDAFLREQYALPRKTTLAARLGKLLGRNEVDIQARAEDLGLQEPKAKSRSRGGRRADLGNRFYRSSWEGNYQRWLNFLQAQGKIIESKYEPKTFWFEDIKRGTRSYTPDFQVFYPDGHYEWHEVKGWMDSKSKTKINRFQKRYPNEKLVLITSTWFRDFRLAGTHLLIPEWE